MWPECSEALHHLVVGQIVEVFVKGGDGKNGGINREETDELIAHLRNSLSRLCRTHGNGDDNAMRAMLSDTGDSGHHRIAGGQSVVGENHGSPTHVRQRAAASITLDPTANFFKDLDPDAFDIFGCEMACLRQAVIQIDGAILGDGSESGFGIEGDGKLARDDDFKIAAEGPGNRGPDNDATAGNSQNKRILSPVMKEAVSEASACAGAVRKGDVGLPPPGHTGKILPRGITMRPPVETNNS